MGLDTTHGCWSGPYSSFNQWRKDVCKAAWLNELDDYVGHGGTKPFPKHPLTPLLDHSDCDGKIKWQDCKGIADALKQILPAMKMHDAYSFDKTKQFIDGCLMAFKAKENVEFH